MLRPLITLAIAVALAAPLIPARGQAAVPLALRLSGLEMVGPGQLRVDAAIAGLEPDLGPTMQVSFTLGSRAYDGEPFAVVAPTMPCVVDLGAGTLRVGGVAVATFPIPPRLDDNAIITLAVTVGQGAESVTTRQTDLLLLPTVLVPGYLNELGGGRADGWAMAPLVRRGYRAGGPSPTLFWFGYRSQRLTIEAAARALADYVRTTVLPSSYADRINVVAYSLGGLVTRWDLAYVPGWDRIVDRFIMVAVPNEGAVASYVDAWYPLGTFARTAAARSLLPTFPFWRATPSAPWGVPPGDTNTILDGLNTHPLPHWVRAYAFYGAETSRLPKAGTWAGVTGSLPGIDLSYGTGDGLVLEASALGLPINGGPAVPGLADSLVARVNLGPVRHLSLFRAATQRVGDALLDRAASDTDDALLAGGADVRTRPAVVTDGDQTGGLDPDFPPPLSGGGDP